MRRWTWQIRGTGMLLLLVVGASVAVSADPAVVRQRYEDMLLRRPRKGTALQNLYKLHAEAMDTRAWLAGLERRMEASPDDAALALLTGLLFSEHGNLEQARGCFQRAAALDASDWYAPYCLGELQLMTGDFDGAAASLERAAEHTRQRENLLSIYMLSGRAHLRALRPEKASSYWDRIVALSPEDPAFIEEVADLLYEEDQVEAAQRYYQMLQAREDISAYQRVSYTLRLAGLEADANQVDEALGRYRQALEEVGTDSWLYHEIYAQIDALFRRTGDVDGLEAIYREEIARNPGDMLVRLRLADFLARGGDADAGCEVLTEAVAAAPSRMDLRSKLADLCLLSEQYGEAIEQLERLVQEDPDEDSYRVRLGQAWRRNRAAPESREQAERWLVSIAERDPSDPERAVRAAEELVGAELPEAATAMFERAVSAAPGVPEYREYLGEHLLTRGDRTGALEVLRGMAAGERRSAAALGRLADILAHHAFDEEALVAAREAVAEAPRDFDAGSAYARLLVRASRFDEALAELARLEALAPNDYFRDEVIDRRIRLLARTGELAAWQEELTADPARDDETIILIAKVALALGQRSQAREWIDTLVKQPDAGIRALEVADSIYHGLGDIEGRLQLLERMVQVDPQRQTDLLKRIVSTYQRIGDIEGAMRAAQSLIDAVPSSPLGHQEMARLHAGLGHFEEAHESLLRAIRVAPDDMSLRMELAGMFQAHLLLPEAIETYWQVFELADDVSGKLAVVRPLAELYDAQGRLEQLVERFRRETRMARDPTAASLALVATFEAVDDLASARRELSALAARRGSDVDVVQRLVGVSRREGDFVQAARYQQRLIELEPSSYHYKVLGDLYLEADDRAAALEAWQHGMTRTSEVRGDPLRRAFDWIEHLERKGFAGEASAELAKLYEEHQDDWRVVSRVAFAYVEANAYGKAFPLLRDLAMRPETVSEANTELPIQAEAGVDPRLGRYPPEFQEMQRVSSARYKVLRSPGPTGAQGAPDSLVEARSLSLAYLALMQGEDPQLDAWMEALGTGTREERRTLLLMALVIQNTEFTRKVGRELLEVYPDDRLGRLVMMTPSRAHLQHGMDDAFLEQVDLHLAWFRQRFPDYAWFYDWHELRALTMHGDPERLAEVAQRLVARGEGDPFVLAQSMSMLSKAKLYDAYEACIDGAVSYYQGMGAQSAADQLMNSLGHISLQVLQEDSGNIASAMRIFEKYLDGTQPDLRRARPMGQGLSAASPGGTTQAFPRPNYWWNNARLNLLRRMHNVCRSSGQEMELMEVFRSRDDVAQGVERVCPLLALAYLHWWNGNPAETQEVLWQVVEMGGSEDELLLTLAQCYEETGDPAKALEAVKRVRTRFGPVHKMTQLWMLRLAAAAGDDETVRAAARVLGGLRLGVEELLDVADHMAAQGMSAQARQLEHRAERMRETSGRQAAAPSASALLGRFERVLAYEQRGQTERARMLARQLLRRPGSSNAQEELRIRQEVLGVLERTGGLAEFIAEAEAQLAERPDSTRVMEELFWYYRGAGQTDKASDLLERKLARTPNGMQVRLQLARLFFDEKDFGASVEQLCKVVVAEPSLFFGATANYWLLTQAFAKAGEPDALRQALEQVTAEKLVGGQQAFRAKRDQTIAQLLNFSRETLAQEALGPGVTLVVCGLLEEMLTTRQLRQQHGPHVLHLRGQAHEALDQPERAYAAYLGCAAGPEVVRALGASVSPIAALCPLQGMTWSQKRPDALIVRFLNVAEELNRLSDVQQACRDAREAGEPEASFLQFLALLRMERTAEAVAIQEEALSRNVGVPSRRGNVWQSVMQQVVAARSLAEAGLEDAAIDLLEQAVKDPLLAGSTGMESIIVNFLVEVCAKSGRTGRARDFLVKARLDTAHDRLPVHLAANQHLQRVSDSLEKLYELGFYADCLYLAQEVMDRSPMPQSSHYQRRVAQLVKTIRQKHLPEMAAGGKLDTLIADAEGRVAASLDDPAEWESLLWLYHARGDREAARSLRERVRRQAGDRPAWQRALAASAAQSGAHLEAVDDYLAVMAEEPELLLDGDTAAHTTMLASFKQAGRMAELQHFAETVDLRTLILGPRQQQQIGMRRLASLTQLSRTTLQSSVDAPEVGLVLARRLRNTISGRSLFGAASTGLTDVMLKALAQMNLSAEARLDQFLHLIASPVMMRTLAPGQPVSRARPNWTLRVKWSEQEVDGLLLEVLDLVRSTGRAGVFLEACRSAVEEGETDKYYLMGLVELMESGSLGATNRINQAVSAATFYRGAPNDRAFLLAVLGQALERAGHPTDAITAYTRALDFARGQSGVSPTVLAGFLARVHIAMDELDQAKSVLTQAPGPTPAKRGLLVDTEQEAKHFLQQARQLIKFGFHDTAWEWANKVLAMFESQPHHRSVRDADRLLDQLIKEHLGEMKENGSLDRLLEGLEARRERGDASPVVYQQLHRLLAALGEGERATRVLKQLEALQPTDPALQQRLAEIGVQAGDHTGAVKHFQTIFRLAPETLLVDPHSMKSMVMAYHAAGAVEDLVHSVVAAMEAGDLPGRGGLDRQQPVVLGVIRLVDLLQDEPVADAEAALHVLDTLSEHLPPKTQGRADRIRIELGRAYARAYQKLGRAEDVFTVLARRLLGTKVVAALGLPAPLVDKPTFAGAIDGSAADRYSGDFKTLLDAAAECGKLGALAAACAESVGDPPSGELVVLEAFARAAGGEGDLVGERLPVIQKSLEQMAVPAGVRVKLAGFLGQTAADAGMMEVAEVLLRDALAEAQDARQTDEESRLTIAYARALCQGGRAEEGAVFLRSYEFPALAIDAAPSAVMQMRLQFIERAVRALVDLGRPVEALELMLLSQPFVDSSGNPFYQDSHARRKAAFLQEQVPAMPAEQLAAATALARGRMEADPQDVNALETYFWFLRSGPASPHLHRVQGELLARRPHDLVLRQRVAEAAVRNEEFEAAQKRYAELLARDPLFLFHAPRAYRDLATAYAGAGQADVLAGVVTTSVLGADALSLEVLGSVVSLADRLMHADVKSPHSSFRIADAAWLAANRYPDGGDVRARAESAAMDALKYMEDREAAYGPSVMRVATPAMLRQLGFAPDPRAGTLRAKKVHWSAQNPDGAFLHALALARDTGRCGELLEAARAVPADAMTVEPYFEAMLLLFMGKPDDARSALPTALQAVAGAEPVVDDQMTLTALLGVELLRKGLAADAAGVLERAQEAADSLPAGRPRTAIRIYRARALMKSGERAAAEALLLADPLSKDESDDPQHLEFLLRHLMATAAELEKMGAAAAARVQAEQLLVKAEGYRTDYYRRQGELLLKKIAGR